MLVKDLFPALASQVCRDLRRLKRADLAEQLSDLRVRDRCRCGSEVCGTFYTEDTKFERRPKQRVASRILRCGAIIHEAGGRIVEIETLDPAVNTELLRLMP
jgi:hypothetical protein